jgi:hypothetical protein
MTQELMQVQAEIEALLEQYDRRQISKSDLKSRLLFMVESRSVTRSMEMIGHMWKSIPMIVPKPGDDKKEPIQLSLWDDK